MKYAWTMMPCLLVACAAPEKRDTVTLATQGPPMSAAARAPTSVPQRPSVLTLATAPGWSGAHGNTTRAVASIWGSGRDVFAAAPGAVMASHDRDVHWSITSNAGGGAIWGASADEIFVAGAHQTDNEEIRKVCFTSSDTMFVAMAYSVWASTDRGASWRMATDVGTEVLGLACHAHEVIAVARNKRFVASSDDGVTWSDHDLDAALPGGQLIALRAAFIAEGGEAFVGGEAYTHEPAGTLLRRAP